MEGLEHRVVRLEVTVENHADDLLELRTTSAQLTASLQAIEKNLTQLKWLAIGISVAVFVKEIGIDHLFMAALGGA